MAPLATMVPQPYIALMIERTPPTLLTPLNAEAQTATADEAAPIDMVDAGEAPAPKAPRLDPTRYGDWELNGKCVDF